MEQFAMDLHDQVAEFVWYPQLLKGMCSHDETTWSVGPFKHAQMCSGELPQKVWRSRWTIWGQCIPFCLRLQPLFLLDCLLVKGLLAWEFPHWRRKNPDTYCWETEKETITSIWDILWSSTCSYKPCLHQKRHEADQDLQMRLWAWPIRCLACCPLCVLLTRTVFVLRKSVIHGVSSNVSFMRCARLCLQSNFLSGLSDAKIINLKELKSVEKPREDRMILFLADILYQCAAQIS